MIEEQSPDLGRDFVLLTGEDFGNFFGNFFTNRSQLCHVPCLSLLVVR